MHSNADKFSSFFSKKKQNTEDWWGKSSSLWALPNSMCSVNLEKKMSKKTF